MAVRTSQSRGTFPIRTGSSVSSDAIISGSAAFLLPLRTTRPLSGAPPCMMIFSIASSGPRGNHPRNAVQILYHAGRVHSRRGENRGYRTVLSRSDLQHHQAVQSQMRCDACRDASEELQTVRAATESQLRFKIAHLWFQPGDLIVDNVGRVGDNQVEP